MSTARKTTEFIHTKGTVPIGTPMSTGNRVYLNTRHSAHGYIHGNKKSLFTNGTMPIGTPVKRIEFIHMKFTVPMGAQVKTNRVYSDNRHSTHEYNHETNRGFSPQGYKYENN